MTLLKRIKLRLMGWSDKWPTKPGLYWLHGYPIMPFRESERPSTTPFLLYYNAVGIRETHSLSGRDAPYRITQWDIDNTPTHFTGTIFQYFKAISLTPKLPV